MPSFNRFDIIEAWYIWLSHHHVGVVRGTKDDPRGKKHPDYWQSYNRLSWIESDFKFTPRPSLEYETLEENGQEIYRGICRRAKWCDCPKENWENM